MARVEAGTYVETGRRPHWRAAVWAGVIGGAVFLILEMLLVALLTEGTAWGPPRMIAAIVLGREVLPPPATFDFGIVLTALVVHFVLAIILGYIGAYLVFRMSLGSALLIGALFGLAVYFLNFYILTAVFPWFAMARDWISVFAHIVFGLVIAWSYKALARREIEHEIKA